MGTNLSGRPVPRELERDEKTFGVDMEGGDGRRVQTLLSPEQAHLLYYDVKVDA